MEDINTHIHELALSSSHRLANVFAGYKSYNEAYLKAFYFICRQTLENFQAQFETQALGELGQLVFTIHHYQKYCDLKKELEFTEQELNLLINSGDIHQQPFALGALRRNNEAKIKMETYIKFFELKLTAFKNVNLH